MTNSAKVCSHRGFAFEGDVCPYHGLCYKAENAFHAPDFSSVKPFDYDLMFSIEDDMDKCFLTNTMEVKTPWYLWMQNTADFLHLKHTHPQFSEQFEGLPYDIRISSDKRNSSHKIKVKLDTVERFRKITNNGLPDYFSHIIYFPRTSWTSFLDIFYSKEMVVPLSENKSHVITKFFTSVRNPVPRTLIESAIVANEKILGEDKSLVEQWYRGQYRSDKWLKGEERIAAFCEAMK